MPNNEGVDVFGSCVVGAVVVMTTVVCVTCSFCVSPPVMHPDVAISTIMRYNISFVVFISLLIRVISVT